MTHQHSIDIYCFNCKQGMKHRETVDNMWVCVNCEVPTWMPDNGRYHQVFQETKIRIMIQCQSPKFVLAYHQCKLVISENAEETRAVWAIGESSKIYVNPERAKLLPNRMLEKLFSEHLNAIVAYRIK